ncbi:MAG: N-acetylneuraminate synthase [Deltaproteobacteria bacterium]
MNKVFIIAEAGINHNSDLEIAKRLVDMAIECGADAIKFQTFKAYESTGIFADMAQYQKENFQKEKSQYEMLKELELSFNCFEEIQKYCKQKGITFISTPDGTESLDFLVSIDVPLIKIGSTEVTNFEFLKEIARKGKPIILSTGMSTIGEVEEALNAIYSTGNTQVQLMHCTTDYPTPLQDVNLKAMITLKEAFKVPVGLSDHTIGYEAAIAAVALGAEIIEKHITLDKCMKGPDHKASMPPSEFKQYVQAVRNTEKLLGDGIKRPTEREIIIMKDVRRSIVAASDLNEGTILSKEMLKYKRPADGIEPKFVYILEGKRLKRNLLKDESIKWSDI